MHYFALATDYDGTLATDGAVGEDVIEVLKKLKDSGRRLILVTGRELDELKTVFPQITLFSLVVAENGAIIYNPSTQQEKILCDPPDKRFIHELEKRGVRPFSVGRVITATWKPHETTVLEIIRDLGLEYEIIFNKDAVMVLPTGLNKATGLSEALKMLGLSPHNVVGIGDAENDHAFLNLCECSAAVSNALPVLKNKSDVVTKGDHGKGVIELINMIIEDDLRRFDHLLQRYEIKIGTDSKDNEVKVPPYDINILLAGTSGGGKSTFAMSFLERLNEHKYQFCIIDPEGDYEDFENTIAIGDAKHSPSVESVMKILSDPSGNCTINRLAIPIDKRPLFFESLFPALLELRSQAGRPHWILVDETHHLLPAAWEPITQTIPAKIKGLVFITVHPENVSNTILTAIDLIIAIGENPGNTINTFSENLRQKPPSLPTNELNTGEAIGWWRESEIAPFWFKAIPPKSEKRRHKLKYVEGELPEDRSFYFSGPKNKLNLRAQNLILFIQIAEGVDDDTWLYHLYKGDYSKWFREMIKDDELADETEAIEKNKNLSASESRSLIKSLIEKRYTAPA